MCVPQSLISACAFAQLDQYSIGAPWVAKAPNNLHVYTEDSVPTAHMRRLIQFFTERSCDFVDFVVLRLIWFPIDACDVTGPVHFILKLKPANQFKAYKMVHLGLLVFFFFFFFF